MTEKLATYDPPAALVDDQEIAFFMADAVETGDWTYIAKALDVVSRAKVVSGTGTVYGLSDYPDRCNERRNQTQK